ncbi:uncharacterized protein B0T15DRAFT_536884 [Chaetomium strumarium]|uniref:SAP domain-containing protein n=1 Tax=Chaetomium strumarium TaxID=1170767 RepID=A0AAJ0GR43_9PEZI|nr:hypothetical protein B0T15DRAFT_536884 [Chaetomium strumarium]
MPRFLRVELSSVAGCLGPCLLFTFRIYVRQGLDSVQEVLPDTSTSAPSLYGLMPKDQLVRLCRHYGLKLSGNKASLIERLGRYKTAPGWH